MLDAKNSKSGTFDANAAIAYLRRAFPAGTAGHVSALAGVPASTVDKWLRGDAAPSSAHLGALTAAFGPGFLAAAFPVAAPWLDARRKHERIRQAIAELDAAVSAARQLAV